jgi:hypothetical protein
MRSFVLHRRCTRVGLLAMFLAGSWATAVEASAAVLVTVHAGDSTDPAPYELRLRSELATEGIDAIVADTGPAGADPKQAATRFGASAVLDVTISATEIVSLVWTADPALSLEVTRSLRVSNQQRDAVAVFALRTVDFLQGARLELEQQRRAKQALATSPGAEPSPTKPTPPGLAVDAKSKPKEAVTAALRPPASQPVLGPVDHPARDRALDDHFGIHASAALLVPFNRFAWAIAPSLVASWRPRHRWAIGLAFAGPFVNHIRLIQSKEYSIAVTEEFAQFQLRYIASLGRLVDLEPHVGFGGSRYFAHGEVNSSRFVGHSATAWSLLTSVGGSLVWHLGSHFQWITDVALLGRWQAPHVVVSGSDLTGSSRWNLLLKTGPGCSF